MDAIVRVINCFRRGRGDDGVWPGPRAGFAPTMDVARIILRVLVNLIKDLPYTPRKLRAVVLLRRRAAFWRSHEAERVDRIRNPAKDRPV